MLASQVDNLTDIKFPIYASFKLDGIRAIIKDGIAYSRTLKKIPNKQIQAWAKANASILDGLDGEFIIGEPNDEDVFLKTTSFVRSEDKQGDFRFYVFDLVSDKPYDKRLNEMSRRLRLLNPKDLNELQAIILPDNTYLLDQVEILTVEALSTLRDDAINTGYEGIMVRSINGKYKHGRSSVKEGYLLKIKLFKDAEFKIVGFEPKYHNTNEAKVNELGRTQRSTSKDGLVAMDTLGALLLETSDGATFGCGTGFDDNLRKELWEQRENLVGKYATIKFFEQGGYVVPRFPVFKAIRWEGDL